jgi:hypothetical protein
MGSNVQYAKVFEYMDDVGHDRGYSVYHYYIASGGQVDRKRAYSCLNEAVNASLQRMEVFDGNNQLVSSNVYEYEYQNLRATYGTFVENLSLGGQAIYSASGMDTDALIPALIASAVSVSIGIASYAVTGLPSPMLIVDAAHFGYLSAMVLLNDDLSVVMHQDDRVYNRLYHDQSINQYRYYLKGVRNDTPARNNINAIQSTHTEVFDTASDNAQVHLVRSQPAKNAAYVEGITTKEKSIVRFSSDYITNYPDENYAAFSPWRPSALEARFQATQGSSKAIYAMAMRNVLDLPIETIAIKEIDGVDYVVDGHLNVYSISGDNIVLLKVAKIFLDEPIPLSNFQWSSIEDGAFVRDAHYTGVLDIEAHNSTGRGRQYTSSGDIPQLLLQQDDQLPMGVVTNATISEVAYTSFEGTSVGWTLQPNQITQTYIDHQGAQWPNARTGNKAYQLNGIGVSTTIPAGQFTLSLWSKGPVTVSGVQAGLIIYDDPDELGWRYLEYAIGNPSTTTLTISGSTIIDELRLYPADAMMSTASTDQLGRMVSTCDINNSITRILYNEKGLPYAKYDHWNDIQVWSETELRNLNDLEGHIKSTIKLVTSRGQGLEDITNQNISNEDLVVYKSFMDGLNRPLQNIAVDVSPGNNDVIQFGQYDQYGEVKRQYMAFTHPNVLHDFVENASELVFDFYNQTAYVGQTTAPFAEAIIDNTPEGRVLEAGGVGEEFQLGSNHTTTIQKEYNSALDLVLDWRCVEGLNTAGASAMAAPNQRRYWPVNTLTKITYTDQNGKGTTTFYEPSGRVVLKRSHVISYLQQGSAYTTDLTAGSASQVGPTPNGLGLRSVDVYHVYDAFGRMVYELPAAFMQDILAPGMGADVSFMETGSANSHLFDKLAYGYHYDKYGRIIEKKSPEVDWESFVYNRIHQVVLAQDAKLRTTNQWNFVRYDALGRVVMNGVLSKGAVAITREQFQAQQDNYTGQLWEDKLNTMNDPVGYTTITVNDDPNEIIYNNYIYDEYRWTDASMAPTPQEQVDFAKRLRGVRTGKRTKLLLQNEQEEVYLRSVPVYDTYGMLVESISELPDGGGYREQYQYNGQQQVISVFSHNKLNSDANTITQRHRYVYGHMGRLEKVYQAIAGNNEVQTIWYQYNELGQVIRKHLHIEPGQNVGMQIVDFRYNAQGWLTKINNADLGADEDNLEDFDAFGMELIYTQNDIDNHPHYQTSNSIKPIAQYNGMLSAIQWKSKLPEQAQNEEQKHSYVYRYDDLYQLTASYYAKENIDFAEAGQFSALRNAYTEITNYNLRGGMTRMKRFTLGTDGTTPVVMDDLKYVYAPNSYRIEAISDASSFEADWSVTHFRQGDGGGYGYDQLGNTISDPNKQLQYQYNALGRVAKINRTGEIDDVNYLYSADGTLHRKQAGTKVTYYTPTIEYKREGEQEARIEHVSTAAGIARINEIALPELKFFYDYYLMDHLGNLRVVVTTEGATPTTAECTMEMAAAYFEEDFFEHVPDSRVPRPADFPDTGHNSDFVSGLKGDGIAQGPGKIIKVAYSDKVEV